MRKIAFATILLLPYFCNAEDCVIRVGYPDRERPPYYLGNGNLVPEPAGAGVDLLKIAIHQTGCSIELVRLPTARLKLALMHGSVDMAPVDLRDGESPYSALPTDNKGSLDIKRGIRVKAVVYVRSTDSISPKINPRIYFLNRKLATIQGAPLGEQLRDEGFNVDSGTADAYSNMQKVVINRVDGFAVSLANTDAMDSSVTEHYGNRLTRLNTPIRSSTLWLSASNNYYHLHRTQIETLWNWWGVNAQYKLANLVNIYSVRK